MTARMTLSKFLIEQLTDHRDHGQLAALLVDITAAIKAIAAMTAKGALGGYWGRAAEDAPVKVDLMAHEELLRTCEWGGLLAGMMSRKMDRPYAIPSQYKKSDQRGRYLLLFDPLGASSNFDLNASVGTIFSVFAHRGGAEPAVADYLRPGREQVAAGYAIYGPATMLVLTVGKGTHGFTLDREIGNFILTHPDLRVAADTDEFAIDSSNERFWESPVQRYVGECKAGRSGTRERDFDMRWVASMVADVHRILMRGGIYMDPHAVNDPPRRGGLRLLYVASPMALVIEQAGGVASTGRERILDITPVELQQHVPVILGSKNEVERIERYHKEFDEGTDKPYVSPLFNERSLFRDEKGPRA